MSSRKACCKVMKLVLSKYLIGKGNGNPLQYSCLENPMDGGAWKAAVHGVAEGRTRLSDFTFTFPFHALEKEMATHSSVLAWRIPGMGEPGGMTTGKTIALTCHLGCCNWNPWHWLALETVITSKALRNQMNFYLRT